MTLNLIGRRCPGAVPQRCESTVRQRSKQTKAKKKNSMAGIERLADGQVTAGIYTLVGVAGAVGGEYAGAGGRGGGGVQGRRGQAHRWWLVVVWWMSAGVLAAPGSCRLTRFLYPGGNCRSASRSMPTPRASCRSGCSCIPRLAG